MSMLTLVARSLLLCALLLPAASYVLQRAGPPLLRSPPVRGFAAARGARPAMAEAAEEKRATADVIPGMEATPATVRAPGCPSCEVEWVAKSKDVEGTEAE